MLAGKNVTFTKTHARLASPPEWTEYFLEQDVKIVDRKEVCPGVSFTHTRAHPVRRLRTACFTSWTGRSSRSEDAPNCPCPDDSSLTSTYRVIYLFFLYRYSL
jgi:hypothetical protein